MNTFDAIILLPLLGVLACFMGTGLRGTALTVSLANLLLGVVIYMDYRADGTVEVLERVLLSSPQLSLNFGVDGLSLVLLMLTVIVTPCAVWFSPSEEKLGKHARMYYVSILLISCGALGAFLSTDLFFFFAFHELALIPTFLMIGILGHGDDKVDVAWRTTIYLSVGSLVVLAGLLGIVIALGGSTFDMATLKELAAANPIDAGTQKILAGILIAGFGILISLFPFHSWAAPAYAAAPTPVAMLHAGVLKKFGLYGIMQVAMPILPEGMAAWTNVVAILLLGNILYIGIITIAQSRLDRTLAYSSVMHMGYVFLGIISFNQTGANGAILLMFAHGISIALLFGLAGKMREQFPTLDLQSMGGMGATAPFFCVTFGMAAFASAGLPGFGNFAAEVLVFFGAFTGYEGGGLNMLQIVTVLALWGVVISAVYMLRAFRNVFQGQSTTGWKLAELTGGARLPVFILLAVLIAVGVFPKLVLDLLPGAVETIIGQR